MGSMDIEYIWSNISNFIILVALREQGLCDHCWCPFNMYMTPKKV